MFWTCFGHVWDMFGTWLGHVWDMFGTCVGHVLDICWTCFGHDWDMFGTEDVILSCNIFWHVFFENNHFLFGGKQPILEEIGLCWAK